MKEDNPSTVCLCCILEGALGTGRGLRILLDADEKAHLDKALAHVEENGMPPVQILSAVDVLVPYTEQRDWRRSAEQPA